MADSGILHALLNLTSREDVVSHPKVGAYWEDFVISQVMQLLAARADQCFHWSTHSGAALDLFVAAGNGPYGFAVIRNEAPRSPHPCARRWNPSAWTVLTWCTRARTAIGWRPSINALPTAELATTLRPSPG